MVEEEEAADRRGRKWGTTPLGEAFARGRAADWYVLAPVGDECRRGGGRRRPYDLVRVTILDEMTEREQEDSSD